MANETPLTELQKAEMQLNQSLTAFANTTNQPAQNLQLQGGSMTIVGGLLDAYQNTLTYKVARAKIAADLETTRKAYEIVMKHLDNYMNIASQNIELNKHKFDQMLKAYEKEHDAISQVALKFIDQLKDPSLPEAAKIQCIKTVEVLLTKRSILDELSTINNQLIS